MGSLKTKQLLFRLAENYRLENQIFSKEVIRRKIDEIKYLSAQKKVPRITLRRNIALLEAQLSRVFELEEQMAKKKINESVKVTALKKQIKALKKRISTSKNKDIEKKVSKLSHLLAEALSKKECAKGIKVSKKMLKELHVKVPKKKEVHHKHHKKQKIKHKKIPKSELEQLTRLRRRLEILRTELKISQELENVDEERIQHLREKINFLEEKIDEYIAKKYSCPVKRTVHHETQPIHSILPPEQPQVKHEVKFEMPQIAKPKKSLHDIELESELPLPPPPRQS